METYLGSNHIIEDCHLFPPDHTKGKVTVASYGLNDILNSQFSQLWKVSRLIETVDNLATDTKIGLLALPPQSNPNINKRVTKANHFIKDKCDQSRNVHFIDCNLSVHDIGHDGVHPNMEGKKKMASTIKDFCHYV